MSIGVERVNGGIIGGQWSEGALTFLKITSNTGDQWVFDGSYGATGTEKGPRPAPRSAAEAVYRILATRGTPVILEIVGRNEIHCAVAYGARGDALPDIDPPQVALAAELKAALENLGDEFAVKRFKEDAGEDDKGFIQANTDELEDAILDFEDFTVEVVPFELA